MITGFKHLHSYLAYIVLIAIVLSYIFTLLSFINKKSFGDSQRKASLIGLIFTHIQFLVGLILYFVSPLGVGNLSGDSMKDSMLRLYSLEHPLMMLLAVVLVTIGYSKAKRATNDQSKYKFILIFYGVGILFMLSRIPWHAWPRF